MTVRNVVKQGAIATVDLEIFGQTALVTLDLSALSKYRAGMDPADPEIGDIETILNAPNEGEAPGS